MFDTQTGTFVWYQGLSFQLPDGRQVPPFSTQSASLQACSAGYLRRSRAPSLIHATSGKLDYCNAAAWAEQPAASPSATPLAMALQNTGKATNASNTTNSSNGTAATSAPPIGTPQAPAPIKYVYQSDFLKVPEYGCIPQPLVQSIKIWNQGYSTYVAAAYIWDQPSSEQYKWYSVVWRWNRDGFVVLESGERVSGFGFEMFQLIPTSAATDVE